MSSFLFFWLQIRSTISRDDPDPAAGAFGDYLREDCPNLQALHYLHAYPAPISFLASLTRAGGCSQLSVLHMGEARSSEEHFRLISHFLRLTELSIFAPFRDVSSAVAHLAALTRLQRLDLSKADCMPLPGLQAVLGSLHSLEVLAVPDLSSEQVAALPRSIKEITVNHSMGEDDMATLLSFAASCQSQLESLTVNCLCMSRITANTASELGSQFAQCEAAGVAVCIECIEQVNGMSEMCLFLNPLLESALTRSIMAIEILGNQDGHELPQHPAQDWVMPEFPSVDMLGMQQLVECCPNLKGASLSSWVSTLGAPPDCCFRLVLA